MTKLLVILAMLVTLAACGPTENATVEKSSNLHGNTQLSYGTKAVAKSDRVFVVRQKDDACYVKASNGEGWLRCDFLSIDDGVEVPSFTRVRPASRDVVAPSFDQYSAQLYCPECQNAGMKINIWKNTSRDGVSGSFPHGTTVTVIGTEAGHYKIRKGNVTGYVSSMMIKK